MDFLRIGEEGSTLTSTFFDDGASFINIEKPKGSSKILLNAKDTQKLGEFLLNPQDYPSGLNPKDYPLGLNPKDYPLGLNPKDYPLGLNPKDYPLGLNKKQLPLSFTQEELEKILNSYDWIKVKRFQEDLTKSLEEQYATLRNHHTVESNFLIEKIRSFATAMLEFLTKR